MDTTGAAPARLPIRTPPSPSDKFLGAFSPTKPETAVSGGLDHELTEDDVFWTGHVSDHNQNRHSSTHPSTSSSSFHRHRLVTRPDSFGILAALPEPDHTRSVASHNASAFLSLSSSSSSSRMIPLIPTVSKKAQVDRHQSAPVKVPAMTEAMRRRGDQFDVLYDDDDDTEGDGEMTLLPPHEVVASRQEDRLPCSVLEGVGRTLKGRDLRQVRNAVWRKTGFLD